MARKKSGRRENKSGTIYFRQDMNTYYGNITIGHKDDGSPIRKTFKGESKTAVQKQMESFRRSVYDEGYLNESDYSERPFEQVVRQWFDTFLVPEIADTTIQHGFSRQKPIPN